MAFTNWGKQAVTYALGSQMPSSYVQCIAVGTGSGTSSVTNVTLITENVRHMITGNPDYSTPYKVTFQGDFNAVEMSGLKFMEFGLFASGASNVGSVWQRETLGSITFDGTNELQIISTLQVY